MMNYLVLDTSTDGATVGVKMADGVVIEATIDTPRRHGRDLVPRLRETLEKAGLRPVDLDIVAVGLGPGSYTGLRIGLAAAKTLAYVAGAEILGLDSLEAIAANAPPEARTISVIADAQRGEVYTADFVREASEGALTRITPTRIEPIATWVAGIGSGTFVIGPGVDSPRIRPLLTAGIVVAGPALNRPHASRMLELAKRAWDQGRRDDPWNVEPLYLRRSAAEEQWDARSLSRPTLRTDRQQPS